VHKKRNAIMMSMFENASSWECPQCFRSNLARKLFCLGCRLPRQTEREKDVRAADQINREELESKKADTEDKVSPRSVLLVGSTNGKDYGMWFVNACSEAAEEEVKEVRKKRKAIMKGGQSMFEHAGSWQCPQCFTSNFARRLWCLGCKLHRQTEREKDVHAADQVKWCEYESRKAATDEEWKAEKRRKAGEMEAAPALKVCVQIGNQGQYLPNRTTRNTTKVLCAFNSHITRKYYIYSCSKEICTTILGFINSYYKKSTNLP
jgi:hypothetical protein